MNLVLRLLSVGIDPHSPPCCLVLGIKSPAKQHFYCYDGRIIQVVLTLSEPCTGGYIFSRHSSYWFPVRIQSHPQNNTSIVMIFSRIILVVLIE